MTDPPMMTLAAMTNSALLPRAVHVAGQQFVRTDTGKPIVLSGPNVVVKVFLRNFGHVGRSRGALDRHTA